MKTAYEDGHRTLFHWQRFDAGRLAKTLGEKVVYCSLPSDFNDPWDCRPFFNFKFLSDDVERAQHADWAVDICRRSTTMSDRDIAAMRESLLTDVPRATTLIREMSESIAETVARRFRVYCLGPDVENLLMWSHYADGHRGVCIEFDLRNPVMCGALRCEYLSEFPVMKLHDQGHENSLLVLLSKADQWKYEREYRLVAQEREHAIDMGTLMTDGGFLKLPDGAISSVIVGCEADYGAVEAVVRESSPGTRIRRAARVPDRYAITIEG